MYGHIKNIAGKIKIPGFVRNAAWVTLGILVVVVLYGNDFDILFNRTLLSEHHGFFGFILLSARNISALFIWFFIPILFTEINRTIFASILARYLRSKRLRFFFQLFYISITIFIIFQFFATSTMRNKVHEDCLLPSASTQKSISPYTYTDTACSAYYMGAVMLLTNIQIVLLLINGVALVVFRKKENHDPHDLSEK
jgi:hypothetical protein